MLLSFGALALNMGFKIFLARIIAQDVLGLFFTAMDFFTLSLLVLVGFRSSMIVSYAKTQEDAKILNIFRAILFAFILLAWGALIPFLKHKMGVNIHYWYLVAALLSMALWIYLSNQLSMYRLYAASNLNIFLEPLLGIGWFCFAWFLFHTGGLQTLFISSIMGNLSLSFILLALKSQARLKEPPLARVGLDKNMRVFLKNSFISTLEFGSSIAIIYLSTIFFLNYHTSADLGNFQMAVKPFLLGVISVFVMPVFKLLLPEFSKAASQKNLRQIYELKRWHLKLTLGVSAVLIVLTTLYSKDLVLALFPAQYEGSAAMLAGLIFAFPFISINAVQISVLKAFGRFLESLIVRLFGVIALTGAFFAARIFTQGVQDVVFALNAAYIAMFAVSFYFETKIYKSRTP